MWRDSASTRLVLTFYDLIDKIAATLPNEKAKEEHIYVCGSDNVIAAVMGMDLGFYSWDVVVDNMDGNFIFLDVRNDTENVLIHDGETK